MPAAMVIPSPLVYIKAVAVKKLVGLLDERPFVREDNYLVPLVLLSTFCAIFNMS